ncbi:MAG: hypothetical protein JW725_01095 [Candidatus Babeliaceae bacterium]|nr:hypothetical protein [Candidatus Babeliaceae bacterium]
MVVLEKKRMICMALFVSSCFCSTAIFADRCYVEDEECCGGSFCMPKTSLSLELISSLVEKRLCEAESFLLKYHEMYDYLISASSADYNKPLALALKDVGLTAGRCCDELDIDIRAFSDVIDIYARNYMHAWENGLYNVLDTCTQNRMSAQTGYLYSEGEMLLSDLRFLRKQLKTHVAYFDLFEIVLARDGVFEKFCYLGFEGRLELIAEVRNQLVRAINRFISSERFFPGSENVELREMALQYRNDLDYEQLRIERTLRDCA